MSEINIRDVWSRIERVLEQHAPATAATLAPPATDEQLAALEAAIGQTLPADLRASLKVHDGQCDATRCHVFCGEGVFLSTAEMADRWRITTEIDDNNQFSAQSAQGPWWKASCIPFTEAEGNMLCVDMDTSLGAQVGEVVCHVHDGEIERGISSNYGTWLTALAARLQSGQFQVDDYGYLWLKDIEFPSR